MTKAKLAELMSIVTEIDEECRRQVELGYDEAHDDVHTVSQLQEHIRQYGAKAVDAAERSDYPRARRKLVQVCALAFKALQAFDRRYRRYAVPRT